MLFDLGEEPERGLGTPNRVARLVPNQVIEEAVSVR
jgi:hypothetical protein